MKFSETSLHGAYIIDIEPVTDIRGYFARTYCEKEFNELGLKVPFVQCNVSYNHNRGTLRGMHYQQTPYEETKLIRCIRGAIYDVIIDIRPESPTYMQWIGVELSEHNNRSLYVPEGFAHGFQTLEDRTEVFYQMGAFYVPESGRGIRWNDPAFGIQWPLSNPIMSDRDRQYSDWKES
ncbi:dTDP-4-dehydrorhamnose 3,5-epimerase [Paenibacillus sediminis]|uniref:dTDP-4-dehydrorhamnose 3,5-epimerase n=1 Tax=Paenibacillus sediminis TaxID=664909 RepID=A0ABS4H287_9BACL|nr:dTDP-4-dehydrorhamnose 3,5-epimerase [Paenibacillus sediminis]MBP1936647.1 dTDP-4-dehydrorhamnose 3,5-epimerase [Paenibacillus sediminis]